MFIHFTCLVGNRLAVALSPVEVRSYADGNTVCLPTVIHCGSNNAISVIARNIVNIIWWNRNDCERTLSLNINCLLSELAYIACNSLSQSEEWITRLLQEMRMNQFGITRREPIFTGRPEGNGGTKIRWSHNRLPRYCVSRRFICWQSSYSPAYCSF